MSTATQPGQPRKHTPTDLKDRSKFGDPVPDESYASQKNVLWSQYNTKYAPAFQQFRLDVIAAVELMAKYGGKGYQANMKRITKARNKYVKVALDAFTEYIESLTKIYVQDKFRTYHVDLTKARTAKAAAKPKKKARRTRK